jgi:sodium/proline symporter
MSAPPEPALFVGFALYLLLMLGVGLITVRYMRSLDDFVLGGRRLGPWVAAISERASGESAWFLLGLPGACYALGFQEFWSVIGIGFGILASWTLVAVGLRRGTGGMGALTLPDFLEGRFPGRRHAVRILSSTVILFFYTIYLGAQFVGAGKILNATFGLGENWGMVVGAGVVLAYTVLGGFLAVAWTDLFQGLLMAGVAILLPVLAVGQLGGPTGVLESLAGAGPGFLTMNAGKTGHAFLFGVMIGGLSWGLGYFGQPHLLVRYMAIRRVRDLRRGTVIAMGWVLIAYWGAAFIGLLGVGVLGPGLEDPEQVMPLMARALVPAWLAGILISGGVAAMMSTADSQLLVATSTLTEDIYVKLLRRGRPPENPALLVRVGRGVTVGITAVALYLAFANRDLIFHMVAYAWSGLGSSFGPVLLLTFWWKGMRREGVLAGLLTGLVGTVLWKNSASLLGSDLGEILDIKAATFLLAGMAAVLGSRVGDVLRREGPTGLA